MADERKIKSRRRGAVFYTPIAVLLILIIAIFGISVFFKITEIEVIGETKYSIEQIMTFSGIKIGDNLIFADTNDASKNIGANLPYLNEIIVEKIIPDKVIIRVTESQPIAVVSYDGSWWIIDQKARALEKTDELTASGKIKVTGLAPVSAVVGMQLASGEGDETKLQYLIDVLSAIYEAGMSSKVKALDMSYIAKITFTYEDRFTIVLGSGENAENKLVIVNNIISQQSDDAEGRIDVSDENRPRFIPS